MNQYQHRIAEGLRQSLAHLAETGCDTLPATLAYERLRFLVETLGAPSWPTSEHPSVTDVAEPVRSRSWPVASELADLLESIAAGWSGPSVTLMAREIFFILWHLSEQWLQAAKPESN